MVIQISVPELYQIRNGCLLHRTIEKYKLYAVTIKKQISCMDGEWGGVVAVS